MAGSPTLLINGKDPFAVPGQVLEQANVDRQPAQCGYCRPSTPPCRRDHEVRDQVRA
jgi:hypothetical protein